MFSEQSRCIHCFVSGLAPLDSGVPRSGPTAQAPHLPLELELAASQLQKQSQVLPPRCVLDAFQRQAAPSPVEGVTTAGPSQSGTVRKGEKHNPPHISTWPMSKTSKLPSQAAEKMASRPPLHVDRTFHSRNIRKTDCSQGQLQECHDFYNHGLETV